MTPSKAILLSLSRLGATTTAVLLFLFLVLNALLLFAVVFLYALLPALSLYYYFIHTQTSSPNRNVPHGAVNRDGESRMFERLVTQVLHGYLGRYVKDFHKHQLKITIWNEEVFLENVELSLEAFDYLQLPFALKQGIALGITGLVAKPAASILEVTGKTAQSIRNRSRVYQTGHQRFRVRLPRPLSREYPLRPYCWEEAVGASVLVEADGSLRLKDEFFFTCKKLEGAGKFVIITERLVLIVSCSSLVNLGKPEFRGVPSDLEWVIESEIHLESVIHADCDQGVVHIVGSSSNTPSRQNQLAKRSSGTRAVRWNNPTVPLIQTNLEMENKEDAENLLQVLLSTIELGKNQGWGCRNILHRSNIK